MSDVLDQMGLEISAAEARTLDAVGKLFETARATAVFSAPVTAGEYTVITAGEVLASGGSGFGGGIGQRPGQPLRRRPLQLAGGREVEGGGLGGGGGGFTLARPVAAITVGPDGVRIRPIVDPTKLALAALTTLGAMGFLVARLLHRSRG